MWRFAVYTQKTTILSKTCLKTVRQALKHTDGRMDYFRFLGNDAAPSIRSETDQPIREVFSFDDFGLLSSNRSQSIESMSSAGGEHNFLEQLLRNDTLNTFSNIQIPTTMSSRELGGSNDIFGYDYVSELLSEGAIPEELAEDLAMEPSTSEIDFMRTGSESAKYHEDQVPSTSGVEVTPLPFLIPNIDSQPTRDEKNDTRKVMTEKIRRERKLHLSTTMPLDTSDASTEQLFHVSQTTVIPNVGEMLFPDSLPQESYTSQWKEGESPAILKPIFPNTSTASETPIEFSLDVLEGIIAEGTMEELRNELNAIGFWPEWIFTGDKKFLGKTNRILRFVVEKSVDYAEAEEIVKKFSASHIRAIVPDDVIIHLISKSITSSCTMTEIIQKLETSTVISLSRELRPNRSIVESRLFDLYTAAIQKCPITSPTLLGICSKLNFDKSANIFMKCYGETNAFSDNFLKTFGEWKKLSVKYGTQQGIDSYWMSALSSEGPMEKRIEALLLHSGKSEHPFSTMARMICAFIKLDQLEKAIEVFQTVSVSGRHFKEPLASFVEKNDLKSIERLAILIERGMIAERRRGGGKRAVNKSEEESAKTRLLSDGVHNLLAKFYGVGGQKNTKFVNKKLKKKIHRIDEGQLHDLCKALQKAWIQCANSKESIERLAAWCQSNRVEIDEKVQKKIDSFSEK